MGLDQFKPLTTTAFFFFEDLLAADSGFLLFPFGLKKSAGALKLPFFNADLGLFEPFACTIALILFALGLGTALVFCFV